MTDPTIAALVKRRAEMTGKLDRMQRDLQQLHADLASMDAVIHQLDPDYPLGAIRPKYRRAPTAGEFGSISRTVLDHLRRAGEPLAAPEIARRIVAERGLNAGDRALARAMAKRVGMALRYQRTNGLVREAPGDGRYARWEVAK